MKILQALPWYYPDSLGGTEIYVAALSRWLAAQGHEVIVAAPKAGLAKPEDYQHESQHVFRYPIPVSPRREEIQEFRRTRGAEWLDAEILRFKPDLVHFHTLGTGLGLFEIESARNAGAGVLLTSHLSTLGYTCQRGSLLQWGAQICDGVVGVRKCAACALQHRGISRTLAAILGAFPASLGRFCFGVGGGIGTTLAMGALIARNRERQQKLFSLLSAFVVLTEWARRVLRANDAPADKIVLNRLGVSHAAAASGSGPVGNPVRIGYVGRFEDIKGVRVLAKAFAALPRTLPIRLEFRGPVLQQGERETVAELQAIAGRDARVSFAPPVPSEQIPPTLQNYDVLCCPSLCLEGGPTIALEAQAAGVPVIGSGLGGLAEIVDHGINGWLVPPGDEKALATILARLAEEGAKLVPAWRARLPKVRTMNEVAADYLPLYERAAAAA